MAINTIDVKITPRWRKYSLTFPLVTLFCIICLKMPINWFIEIRTSLNGA